MTLPMGKINPISIGAVTFELFMPFLCPLRLRMCKYLQIQSFYDSKHHLHKGSVTYLIDELPERSNERPTPNAKLKKQSNIRPHQLLEAKRTIEEPTVEAALCHNAYSNIGLRAPSRDQERDTMMVAAIPVTYSYTNRCHHLNMLCHHPLKTLYFYHLWCHHLNLCFYHLMFQSHHNLTTRLNG